MRGVRVRGFTLLEILLVMVLIAGGMAMLAAAFSRGGEGHRLRLATAQIANGLRDARARAMLTQAPQRFVLNPQAHVWRAGDGKRQIVPAGIRLSMTSAAELAGPEGGVILFYPDGASSGGRITLAQGGQAWQVDVRWLTGQASIRRASTP